MNKTQIAELTIETVKVSLMVTGAVTIAATVISVNSAANSTTDILKVVIGAFSGAVAAFFFNLKIQSFKQKREDKAALYLVFYVLRKQYDEFLGYRKILHRAMATQHEILEQQPKQKEDPAPIWVYAKPFRYTFTTDNTYNFGSISFILDTETGREAFAHLQTVERTYLELEGTHTDYHLSAQEMQHSVATYKEKDDSWAAIQRHTGEALPAKVRDLTLNVLARTYRDGDIYLKALAELKKASIGIIENEFLELDLIDDSSQKNPLPAMPDILLAELKRRYGSIIT